MGYLVVNVSKIGVLFLKRWSYFECCKRIKALKYVRFLFPPNLSTNAIVNSHVYSAYKLYGSPFNHFNPDV